MPRVTVASRPLVVGRAHGVNRVSDVDGVVGTAQGEGGQSGRIHLEQGHVHHWIPADNLRGQAAAIGEVDFVLGRGVVHHMMVGHNPAIGVEDASAAMSLFRGDGDHGIEGLADAARPAKDRGE